MGQRTPLPLSIPPRYGDASQILHNRSEHTDAGLSHPDHKMIHAPGDTFKRRVWMKSIPEKNLLWNRKSETAAAAVPKLSHQFPLQPNNRHCLDQNDWSECCFVFVCFLLVFFIKKKKSYVNKPPVISQECLYSPDHGKHLSKTDFALLSQISRVWIRLCYKETKSRSCYGKNTLPTLSGSTDFIAFSWD